MYNPETIACDEKDDSQRQYLVLIIFWWNVYQNRIQLKWYKYFKWLLISKVCLRDFIFRQWQDLDSLVFGFLLLANISSQHIILYVIVFTKRCYFQSHELDYITSTDSSYSVFTSVLAKKTPKTVSLQENVHLLTKIRGKITQTLIIV